MPYYNKPTQEGLYQHFRKVAETCGLPVILYNVPGRTVADLANDTTLRLAQVPGIVGIKDATGDMARAADLLRRAPKDFAVYSGNDDSALSLMLLGGRRLLPWLLWQISRTGSRELFTLCVIAAAVGDRLRRLRAVRRVGRTRRVLRRPGAARERVQPACRRRDAAIP